VVGITQGRQWEWTSTRTIGIFVVAAILLAAFALWERRLGDPRVPFSTSRARTVAAANVAALIMGTALFSMFLMLTLYMQQVLDFSPLKAGAGYRGVRGTAGVS